MRVGAIVDGKRRGYPPYSVEYHTSYLGYKGIFSLVPHIAPHYASSSLPYIYE